MTPLLSTLRASLSTFGEDVGRYLPHLLSALAIVVVGWLGAHVLRAVTQWLLRIARFDRLVERADAGEALRRAGLGAAHVLVATAVYWLTWIAVGLAALRALGLAGTELLVADVVRFVPRLGSAVLVLVLGFFLASVAWRATLLAAVNARMRAAKWLGALVRMLTLIGAFAIALEQVEVGRGVVHTAFAITFGAIMLSGAIAFGLGGRHAARKFLEERLLSRQREDDDDPASHL